VVFPGLAEHGTAWRSKDAEGIRRVADLRRSARRPWTTLTAETRSGGLGQFGDVAGDRPEDPAYFRWRGRRSRDEATADFILPRTIQVIAVSRLATVRTTPCWGQDRIRRRARIRPRLSVGPRVEGPRRHRRWRAGPSCSGGSIPRTGAQWPTPPWTFKESSHPVGAPCSRDQHLAPRRGGGQDRGSRRSPGSPVVGRRISTSMSDRANTREGSPS